VWILPALYTGNAEDIELANNMVARFNADGGQRWNVFPSNVFAGLLAEYHDKLTPAAREVMTWHTEAAFDPNRGSAAPDLKFHGCNDNMPMMSTKALILGGEFLENKAAYAHGVWDLNEFRRLLSRSAWESEFNSSTYSPITLCNLAKIATRARDPQIREMAKNCEIRLWTELLLHWHPGSKLTGGPQCRAYAIDWAGHTHTAQALFWLVFGPEISGRDLLRSYFAPDGKEILHFAGDRMYSVAEFCDLMDCEYHLPEELAQLAAGRKYPALTRGRSECMSSIQNACGEYHTCSYMEEDFSLGTVNIPLVSGDTSAQFYATYKRKPQVKDFRDGGVVFYRYVDNFQAVEQMASAENYQSVAENTVRSLAHVYPLQKNNVAMLLATPSERYLEAVPVKLLQLAVIFPAHYGQIKQSIIGNGTVQDGAFGTSESVVPVSVHTGEVFIHIYPLLPTALARREALRFRRFQNYEVLELVNYEGAERKFTAAELATIGNGFVFTIDSAAKYPSLEAFHKEKSAMRIVDYYLAGHRFVRIARKDVEFEVTYTPGNFGVQTHAIDGRAEPQPVFATNQLEVEKLPFMSGPVAPEPEDFVWGDNLTMDYDQSLYWNIGSRGLSGEVPYSRRAEKNEGGK